MSGPWRSSYRPSFEEPSPSLAEARHERTVDSGAPLSQEAAQLRYVQPVAADHGPIQKQNRYIEPVAAREDRVAVDVYYLNRRQGHRTPQRLQVPQHLIAQLTIVPVHDR